MHAKINGESFPENTLSMVLLELGGGVRIQGEAINEQNRLDVATMLATLHQGDTVEFDVEDRDFNHFHGPGTIRELNIEEQGVGSLVRVKFYIMIQYIKDQESGFKTKIS